MLDLLAWLELALATSPSAEISSGGHGITIVDASSFSLSTADS